MGKYNAERQKQYYYKNRNIILERQKQHYHKNKDKRKENDKQYRQKNSDKIAEYQKQYRQKNKERLTKQKTEYHQKNREKIKEYHKKNKEKFAERYKQYKDNLKRIVLTHYGNNKLECVCCGEKEFVFLTLDHKLNNGAEWRRKIVSSGRATYIWLMKNKFPKGYQTLCFNCNHAKGVTKRCPCQDERV